MIYNISKPGHWGNRWNKVVPQTFQHITEQPGDSTAYAHCIQNQNYGALVLGSLPGASDATLKHTMFIFNPIIEKARKAYAMSLSPVEDVKFITDNKELFSEINKEENPYTIASVLRCIIYLRTQEGELNG